MTEAITPRQWSLIKIQKGRAQISCSPIRCGSWRVAHLDSVEIPVTLTCLPLCISSSAVFVISLVTSGGLSSMRCSSKLIITKEGSWEPRFIASGSQACKQPLKWGGAVFGTEPQPVASNSLQVESPQDVQLAPAPAGSVHVVPWKHRRNWDWDCYTCANSHG